MPYDHVAGFPRQFDYPDVATADNSAVDHKSLHTVGSIVARPKSA